MSALQISVGSVSGTNWPEVVVTALVPAAVGAGAALLGVWLSNRSVAEQRASALVERERLEARDREFAALALADHFENFALSCRRVVVSFWNVVWESPYSWASYAAAPEYLEDFPPWPVMVGWQHLGVARAVEAENFRRRVQLKREWMNGTIEQYDPEDSHAEIADLAAQLGLEAWRQAAAIRKENGLAPFEWPEDFEGVERMASHLARRAKIKADQASSGPLPF